MNLKIIILSIVALFFLTVSAPGVAISQEVQSSAALYFWGADIGGNTVRNNEIEVDFNDILDNLELAFMGTFKVRKGKWFMLTDVIYLDVANEKNLAIGSELSVEMNSWIVTPAVGFNVADSEGFKFDILGGARYFYLKTDLRLGARAQDESGSMWDGIIGIKGRIYLGESLYIPYYGDIGAGDSDGSWQAYGGLGFSLANIDLELGYRHLEYSFDDRLIVEEINFSGPLAGIRFTF
jgi:hypothetical protein